jgi:molybdate transport system ATP-binding protein
MTIRLDNLTVQFDDCFQLSNINWQLEPDQHWVITGTNGAGKSALAAVLAGVGDRLSGTIEGLPPRVGVVSFEAQAALIDAERKKDDADILDVISAGTPVREILFADCPDPDLADELVARFGLESLLDRAFRKLSTGESRKVMLIRALASKPDLLVLDEPFDGLDAGSLSMLQHYLATLIETVPMVLVLNRFDELPEFITHIAYVDDGELHHRVKRDDITIRYADHEVIRHLDWTINPNQHWQLSGPNGSGKTGLLSLITGDHPQCYVNDIFVFGFQRGSGESIWQIKQFIGYVSTALQWEYRVGTGLRNVIISGFYDSIGLYSRCTDRQREIADRWLALLGMSDRGDQPFNKLSYGDQRLLLIARAMVKHPALLILDEPCLGLDDMNRQLVLALIERICADSETSVIYVNHHPEDRIRGIDNYLTLEKH